MIEGMLIEHKERSCPVRGCNGKLKVKLQERIEEISEGDMVVFNMKAIELGMVEQACPVCGCLLSIPCFGKAEVEQYPISSPS